VRWPPACGDVRTGAEEVPISSQFKTAVVRSKVLAEAAKSSGTRREGTSAVGSRYQATASENSEDFMCAVVTVIFGVCNSVRLS
jgi:hypothetical protein